MPNNLVISITGAYLYILVASTYGLIYLLDNTYTMLALTIF